MKKSFLLIAGMMLLLAFTQCSTNDDPSPENKVTFEQKIDITENEVYRIMEEILTDDNLYETLPILAQRLTEMDEVSSAEVNDYEVDITFIDGTTMFVLFQYLPQKSLSPNGNPLSNNNLIKPSNSASNTKDKKAAIWEPFAIESYGYGLDDDARLISNSGFHVTPYSANDCTVASLQNLLTEDFDYIMFNTHGSPNGKWMATHERATTTTESNEAYIQMKRDGYLATGTVYYFPSFGHGTTVYFVSDTYISSLEGRFNSSIVYAGMCHSMDNEGSPICQAFFRKGAAAFVGYDGSVNVAYSNNVGYYFVQKLFEDRLTVREAYDQTQEQYPDDPSTNSQGVVTAPNQFRIFGESDPNASLFNLSYPTGAINSLFTINDHGGQVCFAQGNLQYQASTNTWRFAPNQYDHIGNDNTYASSYYSGWIDLFCWGTSGWNSGAQEYQPYSQSTNYQSYYTGGSPDIDLTGNYADADWAYHNSISNGGQQTGLWRCLTHEEYIYMMESRANASQKYGYARVNGINGLVILPDSWTLPAGLSFTPQASSWTSNSYSIAQWAQMEAAGAIFLPTTGTRQGTTVFYVDGLGDYWSSTANDIQTGNSMSFFNGNVYPGDCRYRYLGTSVRPAHDMW